MTVLYVLIPLALIIVAGFVTAFVWSVKNGQLDDTDTPAERMLLDATRVSREPVRENGGMAEPKG
ncbi:MAG: cbb3-type cytochrome oxidase assembly protein CcoS [Myxococcales bacterium]|nr:cbb3-type cytochrome oxidase assembly protein CcoS [Myxococcales bacterium]